MERMQGFINSIVLDQIMGKITNKQWQEAHATINQCKKETAIDKRNEMKDFIKERDRTFWKETSDYHTKYFNVSIDPEHAYYATVFVFEVHTNGRNEIKSKHFSENELNDFLEGVSEESINHKRDQDMCDCECECRCFGEEELPKTNVRSITEKQFKKEVQSKVLDGWSIGLTFK